MTGMRGEADISRPNAARMYDYLLGGSANFEVDRDATRDMINGFPTATLTARANRAWLGRVVRYMTGQGCAQFLDLGSGLPMTRNVHQVAHGINPAARVVYVDIDPIAVAYARELVDDDERVRVARADVRHPDTVLHNPDITEMIDFSQPVGIIASAILHFISDDENPAGMMARYRQACPAGSYLAVSHFCPANLPAEAQQAIYSAYARTPTKGTIRDTSEIAALLPGYRLVDPGLVLLDQWHPDQPVSEQQARDNNCYAALGVLKS